MIKYYKEKNGEIVPFANVLEWAEWFQESEHERLIRKDYLKGDIMVITSFIGIDYGNKDYLFETMVFGGKKDRHCEKYTSRKAAIAGHKQIVESTEKS